MIAAGLTDFGLGFVFEFFFFSVPKYKSCLYI